MGYYWKKPTPIEAVKWTGENLDEVKEFCTDFIGGLYTEFEDLIINSVNGVLRIQLGDWLIKGPHGEFFSCTNDIFRKTYEPINMTSVEVAG